MSRRSFEVGQSLAQVRRLTPNHPASSRSGGSGRPGWSSPEMIACSMTSPIRECSVPPARERSPSQAGASPSCASRRRRSERTAPPWPPPLPSSQFVPTNPPCASVPWYRYFRTRGQPKGAGKVIEQSACGRHRRRRRRLLDPVLARAPGLERHRVGRACSADQRVDVPLRGPRRPAALLAQPDADDDELGRALPGPRRRGRASRRAGARWARFALPPRRNGWRNCSGRPPGQRPSACRSTSSRPRRPKSSSLPCRSTAYTAPHCSRTDGYLDPEPAHIGARQGCPPARRHDPHRDRG